MHDAIPASFSAHITLQPWFIDPHSPCVMEEAGAPKDYFI